MHAFKFQYILRLYVRVNNNSNNNSFQWTKALITIRDTINNFRNWIMITWIYFMKNNKNSKKHCQSGSSKKEKPVCFIKITSKDKWKCFSKKSKECQTGIKNSLQKVKNIMFKLKNSFLKWSKNKRNFDKKNCNMLLILINLSKRKAHLTCKR